VVHGFEDYSPSQISAFFSASLPQCEPLCSAMVGQNDTGDYGFLSHVSLDEECYNLISTFYVTF
jgi:hypothetical protein